MIIIVLTDKDVLETLPTQMVAQADIIIRGATVIKSRYTNLTFHIEVVHDA